MKHTAGFTLVEVSIVLAIIAVIAASILVGRDLLTAAAVRAQITQFEQYHATVHTFRNKYNALPGDMHYTQTASAGLFTFTGPLAGHKSYGDNNGLVQSCGDPVYQYECGETLAFWRHLSDAQLIDGRFGINLDPASGLVPGGVPPHRLDEVLPPARFDRQANIAVTDYGAYEYIQDGRQYMYITSKWQGIAANGFSQKRSALSSPEAYMIDSKLDDGYPHTGNVRSYGQPPCIDYVDFENTYLYRQGDDTPVCVLYFHFN